MSTDSGRTVELRLRAAVESAPSGLLMVDPEGRIVLVNREVERLFGYSREELLGRPVELLIPEDLRDAHLDHRGDFHRDPRVRAMGVGRDLHGRRKDGTRVPVEVGLTPVATEEGLFVLSSIVDISARRRAEARFRAAVESSPAGMVMVDRAGRIVLVNREVERMFGYTRDELLGANIEMLVPERFRTGHPVFREGFYRSPGARAMGAGRDLFGLRKDGTEIPVEIGLNPIEMEDELLILSSIVDISARKEEEAVRERLEAQLRQAQKLEAVGTLAGGIAHDFNNILGGIVGFAELVESSVQDPRIRSDVHEILRFARRGKDLVHRILAFSRRQETGRRPVHLAGLVEEVVQLLASSADPRIRIHVRVDPNLPPVLADPAALHQLLMNLGVNAVQAMPRGGELTFSAEALYVTDRVARAHPELQEGPYVALTVRDTGVGMDPAVRSRAFEPFFTTRSPGGGSGLGLAIVHAVVTDHDGAVQLESEPGAGTTVRCLLPLRDRGPIADEEVVETMVPLGRGERVLLVDDEEGLAVSGGRRLESIGYRVTVETRGEEALRRVKAAPGAFDVVITDYLMPAMTGLQLAGALTDLRRDLPVILLTGFVEDLAPDEMEAVGVRRVIRKPASLRELGTLLREVLDASPGGGGAGDEEAQAPPDPGGGGD